LVFAAAVNGKAPGIVKFEILLRFLAIFSIVLLPALSETEKERAHEAEAAVEVNNSGVLNV
jgi:hypothetical protein